MDSAVAVAFGVGVLTLHFWLFGCLVRRDSLGAHDSIKTTVGNTG